MQSMQLKTLLATEIIYIIWKQMTFLRKELLASNALEVSVEKGTIGQTETHEPIQS